MRQKLTGILQLFRPELPFAAGVCVVLGEIIPSGGIPPIWPILLGFSCGFFLSGTALVLNDYFDLEVDRVNAPQRALPSGKVSPREAIIISIVATLLGLASAFALGLPALILSIIFWGVGVLYNWKFKQTGLPGNLMVSSSVAVTFILGGMAVGQPWNNIVWFFSLQAFLIDLAEEIAGDAMDIEGDRKRGSKSIAIRKGKLFALRVSAALFALIALVAFVPFLLGWLGKGYLILVSILSLALIFITARLLKSRTPEEGRSMMRRIYLLPLFGMLVFIIWKIIE